MTAYEPYQRDQHEIRENPAGAENHGTTQTHDIAQTQDETDGIKAERHSGAFRERAKHRQESQINEFLPNLECRNEQIVDTSDGGRLQQQLGLRSTLLAGDQHFGDGRGFRVREFAVHVAHEVASQWNQKKNTETAAGKADEDRLHRVRIQLQDVQRRNREDGSCNNRPRNPSDTRDDHILEQAGSPAVEAGQTNGQDRNRNGRFHHLSNLEARISGCDGKDDAEKDAPANGSSRKFRQLYLCGHNRRVRLARFQQFVRTFGE
jgi:hypothetical protein